MANSVCERFGGTLRRECLDYLIPLNERHLKMTTKEWVRHYNRHYNRGRPHSSLGPGVPEPNQDKVPASDHRHKLPAGYRVVKTSVLAACIMSIAWQRRLHNHDFCFCGLQDNLTL
jgi:putative transposase